MKSKVESRVTVDLVVFGMHHSSLHLLLVKRKIPPFEGCWALPGGFVLPHESLEQAALRELVEETSVRPGFIEQLYTFGDPGRDPRGHVVTIAYLALLPSVPEAFGGSDAQEACWHPWRKLPELAFDHRRILNYAITRLRNKLEWTTAGFGLLPPQFTLGELQAVYEQVLDKDIDKRNFRRKLESLEILKPLKHWKKVGATRPAQLFELSESKVQKLRDKGILFPF